MDIRDAILGDEAQLAAQMKVAADEGRWIATERDRSVEDLEAMFRSGLEEGHIIVALEHEGEIAGACGIHPTGVEGVSSLGMSIVSAHRHQGWGRKLAEAAIGRATERGLRKIVLEVFPDNGAAIALYVSLGFDVEGLKRDHYPRLDGSVRSALLMARFL